MFFLKESEQKYSEQLIESEVPNSWLLLKESDVSHFLKRGNDLQI